MDEEHVNIEVGMQRKTLGKRKKETQSICVVVQGYWIKERKRIKVKAIEREVTVVKSLVTSPNNLLPNKQCVVNNSWGFVTS